MAHCNSKPKKMEKGGAAKPGFGQGSGSEMVDAMIAADPIKNLSPALKVELKKLLKKGVKKMEFGGEAGRTISDADRNIMRRMMGETGKSISDADRKALNQLIGQISGGKKKKTPSGPPKMPQAVRNMRARSKSKGGAGEAGPAVTRYRNGGCVMAGRGGKFKGIS